MECSPITYFIQIQIITSCLLELLILHDGCLQSVCFIKSLALDLTGIMIILLS